MNCYDTNSKKSNLAELENSSDCVIRQKWKKINCIYGAAATSSNMLTYLKSQQYNIDLLFWKQPRWSICKCKVLLKENKVNELSFFYKQRTNCWRDTPGQAASLEEYGQSTFWVETLHLDGKHRGVRASTKKWGGGVEIGKSLQATEH